MTWKTKRCKRNCVLFSSQKNDDANEQQRDETKTLEKENVSSPSYFPVKGGRGSLYRNDVKVKKNGKMGGFYTISLSVR